MTAPIETMPQGASQHLWSLFITRLVESDDAQELMVLLAVIGELEPADLPITALAQMYVRMAQNIPTTLDIFAPDLDEDLFKPCRELIECSPKQVPISILIEALRAAYAIDDGDEELQDRLQQLVHCLAGVPTDVVAFTALLQDSVGSIRCGGLDAMYYLGRSDGIDALLDDPDAHVRQLAIENMRALGVLPIERVQEMATSDPDADVRAMAVECLAQVTGTPEQA